MPPRPPAPGAELTIRTVGAIKDIARADWDACANPGWPRSLDGLRADPPAVALPPYNPFISHDFLACLEESGSASRRSGWAPTHLLAEAGGRVAGVLPAYLKSHSMGEYVFDHGWADAFERAGGRYYPKVQISVPFTPATGRRLLCRPADAALIRPALAGAAREVTRRQGASSVHATFLPPDEADFLESEGWLIRTDRQFHFVNEGYRDFDDFLAALASRKRKAVKRERRDALTGGVEVSLLTGAAIGEADWDAFFAFYMDTGSRKWGRPYLNRRFFSLIGERMADRVLLIIAKKGGRPIAGALNFIGSDTLFGRYWGATEEQPFLHFEICYYQAIEWGIAHGMRIIEAGAQGDHKLARGYVPVTTRSAHWIADARFRAAIADYLVRERQAVEAEQAILAEHVPFRNEGAEEEAETP